MDFKLIADDPLFWSLVAFAAALLIIWINRYREDNKYIRLFEFAPPPVVTPFIPNNYIHFGLRSGRDSQLENDNYILTWQQPLENTNGMDDTLVRHIEEFRCQTERCTCEESSSIFINLRTIINGSSMPTEAGSPPRSTISRPTGTGSGGSESFDLNIISNNQYIPVANVFDFVQYLPLQYINSSDTSNQENGINRIAIIDTGLIDRNHSQNIDPMFFSGVQSVCERFSNPDSHGHGTFAYYFLKVGLNARNITNYEIYPYNVANKNGDIELGNALCAIVDAAERGVKTINLSFGFYDHWLALQYFFELLFSVYPDLKVVCSAGNYHREIMNLQSSSQFTTNLEYPHPPSYYNNLFQNNIFQITALETNRIDNSLAGSFCPFTNYEDGINIGCQGSYVLSLNNQDCLLEGTSFAAPFFAGYYASHINTAVRTELQNLINNNLNFAPPNYHSIIPFSNYIS